MDVGVGFHGVYDRSTLHATETILFGDWVYLASCARYNHNPNSTLSSSCITMHAYWVYWTSCARVESEPSLDASQCMHTSCARYNQNLV